MLQIKHISKQYQTGELVQQALDGVSLNLRENEFVSVLGPSGSGKTTLLNIIGGLDRYDTGDLVINGISTRKFKDRDWDAYRNHAVGFVFQSYNLIPHQSILANVELALTIGGLSRNERRMKAKEALEAVGLGEQIHKKPNQMSGGQMQRVAIARALVNNPDILLADEPTGALDSETSVQVMELLKEVAKERLVVMVTHNSELAERYSTRIVRLRDGEVVDDSNPYKPDESEKKKNGISQIGKAKMSFFTSLSLSFHNLRTKKVRMLLTSFAGSIGIIGIALILALSNGVNEYIDSLQKDTMASYPITISGKTVDMTSIMGMRGQMMGIGRTTEKSAKTGVYADNSRLEVLEAGTAENDLAAFKEYLDDPKSEIQQYLGESGVVYTYNVNFNVYSYDSDGNIVSSDADTEDISVSGGFGAMAGRGMPPMMGNSKNSASAENFSELMAGSDDSVISTVITDSYDLLYGTWPENYDETVLVLDEDNSVSTGILYQLGLITADEYKEIVQRIKDDKEVDEIKLDYKDVCKHIFYIVPACDHYLENEDGTFAYIGENSLETEELLENALQLRITGIIRPVEDAANASITTAVAYTSGLTDYIISYTDESAVVLAQEQDPEINVLNGMNFEVTDDAKKTEDTKTYIGGSSYESNMGTFGKVSYDTPASISIYTDSFEDKEAVAKCIENYNETVDSDSQITYTDYVKLLTSSLTSIIDVISYVLIAFVAVSLVVSCIMIGIITHISVLERTKEIGILRALGASKRNISQVFNAETLIIGLCSGTLGIAISMVLTVPVNIMIRKLFGAATLSASLPLVSAVALIALSMAITVAGGLLPAKKAAKKDPVIALRTE